MQAQGYVGKDGRLEQRTDVVLDRRSRRPGQEAPASDRQYRLPPLCLRAEQPARCGRPPCTPGKERRAGSRPARRLSRLRRGLVRGLLPRSRRPEARGDGIQTPAQNQAQGEGKTLAGGREGRGKAGLIAARWRDVLARPDRGRGFTGKAETPWSLNLVPELGP